MDTAHHQRLPPPAKKKAHHQKGKRKGGGDDSLKVVYISSPMKVRTSATRFRSLVQQLTGKNSDIARYMDVGGGGAADFRDEDGMLLPEFAGVLTSVSSDDNTTTTTPATSDSFLGAGADADADDNALASQMEDQFAGFFSSDSFCVDPSQMDVLGSYHDLFM